jgi:gliding motility-associated-like protein
MKKIFTFKNALLVFSFLSASITFAQLADGFDIKKAYQQAKDKGIPKTDIEGYVQFLHNDYISHKGHSHNSSAAKTSNPGVYDAGVIYKSWNNTASVFKGGSPNSPQNAYCPNAGFEQLNFANWTGSYGAVSTGAAGAQFPTYTQTSPTIVNTAGNNVSIVNTVNYHTIMTTPATNSVYPNCVGWDSIACRVIGTQTVSEIPVVNPTGGPASVRLNGANANYRASKLTYNMTLNPNNKNFNISYALVLDNGGHMANEQPYFSVRVTDQNGTLVPGCSTYTVTCSDDLTNPASPLFDPSWTDAVIGWGNVMYRKWTSYAFDFSNYPAITSVNVEFYVGGCSLGGHWGYAYVDAECSQGGAVASFCANDNEAILTAPAGYTTYQWIGPLGPISVPNGGNTGTATITPVSAGQVFTCNVTAPNGCASSFQTTVAISSVSITGISSTPSCPNGNSGTADVTATGSSNGYNYQWVNSLGSTVSTAQNATGLSPGIYTVNVSAILCGLASATVAVGVSPPAFYTLPAPYCGTTAWITNNGGSNYKWYTASPLALIAGATSSSLTINSPVNGAAYFLVYTTASGCKDSIRYVLNQQPGGSIYASNIKSICAGNNNSYAVINLQTTAPPVYSYTVTGPAGYNSILNNTNSLKDSVINLSIGTYSATVFDGQCLYNTTFTVSPFVYSYTLTPTTSTICSAGSTSLAVNFGNTTPSACGLSTTGGCTTPNLVTIGTGTGLNGNNGWPSIYGNWYKNARHQLLYTAAELSAAGILPGKISSLAFNISSIPAGYIGTLPGVTISLKCTSVNVLTSTFDNNGLVQVYNAANYTPTAGWNTHNFTTAYEWDGVSNILVDICYNFVSSSNYTSNPFNTLTGTGTVRCIYAYSDSSPMCLTTNFATTSLDRPNIRFANCGGSNPNAFTYTWTPSTGLSSTTSYTTIANPLTTTVYSVQVNPIGQTNCMQAQTATVNVTTVGIPTITPVSSICSNASNFTLTATPAGGTWSCTTAPTNSVSGVFTSSLAAIGSNTVTYTYGTVGCLQMTTAIVPVERFVPSTITGTINAICLPGTNTNLATALTTSTLGVGVWSGNGVTGTTFDPNAAGVGTHTLTYSTNSIPTISLCPSQSTIVIAVNSAAQPTITTVNPLCTNASVITMSVTPTGGTWSGTGISPTGVFTPSLAAIGNNTYLYTVGASTCSASNTTTISVEQYVPSTITGSVNALCITNPAINLSTALATSTLGVGVWSGNGVTGTTFDPAVAGAGSGTAVHTLTYSTNSTPTTTLCPSSSTLNITVNSLAQPTITAAGPYCDNYAAQNMTVTPTGGVWSVVTAGSNVTGTGVFSPASAVIGNNTLLYTLTNGPCVNTETVSISVVDFIPATITNTVGPYCIYDAGTNLQTIAQFTGGTWSGPGVTGTSFSPAAAGAGIHTITYSTDPSPAGLCPDSKNITITVNAKPEANAFPNITVGCNPVTINYTTSSVNTGTATWNFGDGSPTESGFVVTHMYTTPGTYTATLYYTDNIGCKDTTIATSGITVHALPIASFDPSVTETTVVDGMVEFTNQSTILTNNTYNWDFGGLASSTQVDESYLFSNSGNFVVTLTATSAEGCVDDTSIVIIVNPDVVLYVPNAFTPGTDGLNDVFQIFLPPTGVDYSTFNLVIFNRWGELIYETKDVNVFWNGKKNNSGDILKQDVYVYKITFKDEQKKNYEKTGHVSLLRK